jgi:hypothetical protein
VTLVTGAAVLAPQLALGIPLIDVVERDLLETH